jgi:predicted O-methyltransferase YrrM
VLDDLHERDREERRKGVREPSNLKALTPPVARLLYLLILHTAATRIVEFGTSHGYSTIHLAAAAERTDGHVYTVDVLPAKSAAARANPEAAGLSSRVSLATCEGVAFVESLPAEVDFVLVDYGVPAFAPAFDLLRDRIAPGGLMFVDGGPEGYWESG